MIPYPAPNTITRPYRGLSVQEREECGHEVHR